jgi:hypothetical protein
MTDADDAVALVRDMPHSDRPISEIYRLVAKAWVEAEHKASLLENTKSSKLSELMLAQGEMPVSRAEMIVKASTEWRDHLVEIDAARKTANLRKVQMEYVRMTFAEWQAADANQRHERRMSK